MSHQFSPDVERLLRDQMISGNYKSEDEVLRDALGSLKARNDDLASVQAGLSDMREGRTRPLADAVDDISKKHGFTKE